MKKPRIHLDSLSNQQSSLNTKAILGRDCRIGIVTLLASSFVALLLLGSCSAHETFRHTFEITGIGSTQAEALQNGLDLAKSIGKVSSFQKVGKPVKKRGQVLQEIVFDIETTPRFTGHDYQQQGAKLARDMQNCINLYAGFVDTRSGRTLEVTVNLDTERYQLSARSMIAFFEKHVEPANKGVVITRVTSDSPNDTAQARYLLGALNSDIRQLKPAYMNIKQSRTEYTLWIADNSSSCSCSVFRCYRLTRLALPPIFPSQVIIRFFDADMKTLGNDSITLTGVVVDGLSMNRDECCGATLVVSAGMIAHSSAQTKRFGVMPQKVYTSSMPATYRVSSCKSGSTTFSLELVASDFSIVRGNKCESHNLPVSLNSPLNTRTDTALVDIPAR